MVALALARAADHADRCSPRVDDVSAVTGLDPKTVRAAVDDLEGAWLVDTGAREGKTHQIKVYRISLPKTDAFDIQRPPEAEAFTLKPVNGQGVAYIPLADGSEFGVPAEFAAELEKLYPAVDVPQTLNDLRGWNLTNPSRRKTTRGIRAHINAWMAREQNKAR